MTTDPQHEHIDLELAADFDERLLDAAASADVAARVAACPTCAATLDAISRTRATLADLPPLTMPAAIADRLHAALAEETLSAQVPGGATTVVALDRPSRRPAARVWLPAAVGIAAAAAIVAAVSHSSPSHGRSSSLAAGATSAPAAAGAAAGVPTRQSGIDYADSAAAKRAAGTDSQVTASSAAAAASREGIESAAPSVAASGSAPAAAATSAAASASASTSASADGTGQPAAPVPDAAGATDSGGDVSITAAGSASPAASSTFDRTAYTPLYDPATLDACVARLVDPETGIRPSLIDYAAFKGVPALAVYFPSDVAGESDVYVVGVHCGPVTDDLLDYLLHVPTPAP